MSNQIVQWAGKVTKTFIRDVDSEPLINVLNLNAEYEDARKFWTDYIQQNFWKIIDKDTVARWGSPNINMMDFESAPGVWIFDDVESDIIWYIWSDLHRKNAWKGTSFEVFVPKTVSGAEMTESLKRFTSFLK